MWFSCTSVAPYFLSTLLVVNWMFTTVVFGDIWLALWVAYAVLPFIDLVFPMDNENPTKE
jgi:hypothetical protein